MRTLTLLLGLACALAAAPASAQASGDFFTVTGTGLRGAPRDGQLATQARLGDQVLPLAALPDGGFLLGQYESVWRVDPSGVIHRAAGTGRFGSSGDGGPALRARVVPDDLSSLPGGGFLIDEGMDDRVRMVDASGVITTVAGGGTRTGEGIPATQAALDGVEAIAALPGGGFLIALDRRVLRVGPDGILRTVAGNGRRERDVPPLSGQPATSVPIDVADVAAAADGSFLIADLHGRRVDRVAADGAITEAAARPGKPFEPDTVTAASDGSFLIGDGSSWRVWRAGAGGRLSVVAGGGFVFGTTRGGLVKVIQRLPLLASAPLGLQQHPDGEPATTAYLGDYRDVAALPDGGVLVSSQTVDFDGDGGFVRYVAPAAPGLLGAGLVRLSGRVLHSGRHTSVTVALTLPATVRLTVAGRSVVRRVPAGRSRVILPALPVRRPLRLTLNARTPDGRAATDSLRLYPAGWLPGETAELVADGVHKAVLPHSGAEERSCRRMSAARVDCRVAGGGRCAIAAISFARGRVRWSAYRCGYQRRPVYRRAPRPLRRRDWGCQSAECLPALFGRVDETAILPAR